MCVAKVAGEQCVDDAFGVNMRIEGTFTRNNTSYMNNSFLVPVNMYKVKLHNNILHGVKAPWLNYGSRVQ